MARARLGRLLTLLGWSLFVILFAGFLVFGARAYLKGGISIPLVVITLSSWCVGLLLLRGQELTSGAPADWRFLRWPRVISTVLQLGVLLWLVAHAHAVERGSVTLYRWIPTEAFRVVHGWGTPTWAAIALSIPVWVIWTVVVILAVTFAKEVVVAILGRDSPLLPMLQGSFGGIEVEGAEGDPAPER
jgi:hypothetical protein